MSARPEVPFHHDQNPENPRVVLDNRRFLDSSLI